ncbi:MAG: stalk domain-containing protein [Bacillota bacterium]
MKRRFTIFAAGTALLTALFAVNFSVFAASNTNTVAFAIENLDQPWGLAAAADGGIIVVSSGSNQINKIKDGQLSSLAGQTKSGYLDGAASASTFNNPTYSAVGSKGTIYISDTDNHVIRKIENNKVYTFAGNGQEGYKDGKYGDVRFHAPTGLALDANNNLYVADTLNNVIRKITPEGIVSTFAGIAGDTGGYKDGGTAEAIFNEPMGLVLDEKGGLYVADSGNHLIRYIHDGKVTTIAGKVTTVDALTGYMTGGYVNGTSSAARFNRPRGLAYAEGVLFVADSLNNRIRAVQPNGKVVTIAGQSKPGNRVGAAEATQFNQPSSLLYHSGKLYVSDTLNDSVKVMEVNPAALKPINSKEDLIEGTELLPAGKDIQVWVDGKQVKFSSAKSIYNSGTKTYIPVRALFAAMGADVKWNAAAKEVKVAKGEWKLTLKPEAKQSVLVLKGTAYVEASYLENAASFLVAYDEEYNAIVINSGQ